MNVPVVHRYIIFFIFCVLCFVSSCQGMDVCMRHIIQKKKKEKEKTFDLCMPDVHRYLIFFVCFVLIRQSTDSTRRQIRLRLKLDKHEVAHKNTKDPRAQTNEHTNERPRRPTTIDHISRNKQS